MATEKQIRANRENAKKSTGPRTPEGKARSSRNARKHGRLSTDAVIPGEDPAEFDRLLNAVEAWALPRNYLERQICLQIADAQWRMQRISRIETAVITADINQARRFDQQIQSEGVEPGREVHSKLLGNAMLGCSQSVVELSRYHAHLTSGFYRSVELLTKIRQDQREAREALNQGDDGFDVYSPTDSPDLEKRYVPSKNPLVTLINRAANVSERYQMKPQDPPMTPIDLGGPTQSPSPQPTLESTPPRATNAPTQQPSAEGGTTTPAKEPPRPH